MAIHQHHVLEAPMRDGWGGSGGGVSSGRSTDQIIQEHLESLAKWAEDNYRDSRFDLYRYWSFKIPAIMCSVSTSALGALGYKTLTVILGIVSTFCIAIDAVYPGGVLHNTHRRAANEISALRDRLKTVWDQIIVEHQDGDSPKKREAVIEILSIVSKEKGRINTYLTAAEAGVGKRETSNRQRV